MVEARSGHETRTMMAKRMMLMLRLMTCSFAFGGVDFSPRPLEPPVYDEDHLRRPY
jgi:hypothetical protein